MKTRILLVLAAAAFAFGPASAFAQKNSCLDCHAQLDDALKVTPETIQGDIHLQFGLTCVDCHGGDAAIDDDTAMGKGFKGAPKRSQIPDFCARCHSDAAYMRQYNPSLRVDQLSQYETSKHGQQLKKGDLKVAVCTDCHGVHAIQSAKFPKSPTFPWNIPQTCGKCHADAELMKPYGIKTDQLAEYKESVHAEALFDKKDMSAPTCNDCHGNHGAVPPEVKSIASVCRQCHPSTGDLFSRSPHKAAFDEIGLSECEACHGNHRILRPSSEMIGTGDKSVCVQCHDPGSAGYKTAAAFKASLDAYQGRFDKDLGTLEVAERKGVEVSEALFKLQAARTVLVSAKNLVHSLSTDEVGKKLAESDAVLDDVEKAGAAALDEAKFRRRGLIVVTAFLALFGIALYVKIRTMRKPD
jgi:predicted CXXCH cytochrome family protein